MKGAKETLSKKLFDQYEMRFLRLEQLKKNRLFIEDICFELSSR